jgi:HAD superfamily hydrolase (TIGR01509 family)
MPSLAQPPPAAVLLDAGFTLIFPDGERIAEPARAAGLDVDGAAIEAAEDSVRREISRFVWPSTKADAGRNGALAGGVALFRRFLELARPDADGDLLDRAAAAAWRAHRERNAWARVGLGVPEALARLRAAGIRLAVVSNSEGTLAAVLTELGLARAVDTIVDSWDVGVAKPDPAIFHLALERLGVPPGAALMVGDTPATDIAGARAAGVRVALVDPLGLHGDVDAPRFRDLAGLVDAIIG